MNHKDAVRTAVRSESTQLINLSHAIHDLAETAFVETQSRELVVSMLRDAGFSIESVDGLPTAFVARFGTGSLNIGLCVEYDALPNIGHACGHNIIAASAVGAALALAPLAASLDLTITVLGTPAEEGGGGKILMLQKGSFDGMHAAMMIHPSAIERDAMKTLAVSQFNVDFYGRAAHAAAAPERGLNAAAAMALAQVGIGMLREHLTSDDRVHGIVIKGGDAPNIVPAHTSGLWYVRSTTARRLTELEPRIIDVFKGAAMMTGCRLEMVKSAPTYTELRTDSRLAELWRANTGSLGRNSLQIQDDDGPASTDMGNVSYAVPTIHPLIALEGGGANIHEAAFAVAARSSSGDQAVINGAIAMAWTAIDMAINSSLRDELVAGTYAVDDIPKTGSERNYLGFDFDEVIRFPS